MANSVAAASAATHSTAGDVRRQGGWLPDSQDDLEAWLAGHRDRVAARGGEIKLHPVIAEFQALIDSDPVVRMYLNEMIVQVPRNRQYSKRHLESVQQMLQLINEVLTMAPEYSEDAMVLDHRVDPPIAEGSKAGRRAHGPVEYRAERQYHTSTCKPSPPPSGRSQTPAPTPPEAVEDILIQLERDGLVQSTVALRAV